MSQIEFSVVIPVHNGEPYISQAIESVLSQSYPHFEILLLENGSTDTTLQTVQRYSDPRIKVFPAPQLLGIEANWARILELDLKEFLTILCHDDILYPGYLAEIARLIETEPKASLYHSHFYMINEHGEKTRESKPIRPIETAEQYLEQVHNIAADTMGSGYTMRSRHFRQVGGVLGFPGLHFADILCWASLSQINYKVCSPLYLFAFRLHSQSNGVRSTVDQIYEAAKLYVKAIEAIPHDPGQAKSFIEHSLKWAWQRWLFSLIESSNPHRFDQYMQVKSALIAKARLEGKWNVYPRVVRLHELLARMPTITLRRFLSRLLEQAYAYKAKRSRASLKQKDVWLNKPSL